MTKILKYKKLYIVSGASNGLGFYIAKFFSKNSTVFAFYNKNNVKSTKNFIAKKIDFTKKKQIENFFIKNNKTIRKYKEITFLSFATSKNDQIITNLNYEKMIKDFKVNTFSNYYICSKLIANNLNKKIKIIFFSSSYAIKGGDKGISVYSGTKIALEGLMRSIVSELSKFKITCNIVALGFFKSPLWDRLKESTKNKIFNKSPSKRLGRYNEIINTIKFIEKTEYFNGRYIELDGGFGLTD